MEEETSMITSEKTNHLVKAFANFSANVVPMAPDQEGAYGGFLSLGKILSQTQGDLISSGLIVIQGISNQDGGVTVTSRLIHTETNEWIECAYTMTPERSGPQAEGAVISYCRRYSLMTLLGLSVEQGEDIDTQRDTAAVAIRKQPATSPPVADSTRGEHGAVLIRNVSVSQGEGKNGEWTRWAIEMSDDRKGSTFDELVGAAAESAHEQEALVLVTTKPSRNPKYLDVLSITEGPPDADEIPF